MWVSSAGGRIVLARQVLMNPDFAFWDSTRPLDWNKYAASSVYRETSSLVWPPGQPTHFGIKAEVYSSGSTNAHLYQYLTWGAAGNPEGRWMFADQSCHTLRGSAWFLLHGDASSGWAHLYLNNAEGPGAAVISPNNTGTSGWWYFQTGITHIHSLRDVSTSSIYLRLSKGANSLAYTGYWAAPRVWMDELALMAEFGMQEGGGALKWSARGPMGQAFETMVGQRRRWVVPVVGVSSAERARVNAWWAAAHPLVFTVNNSPHFGADYGGPDSGIAHWYGYPSAGRRVPEPFYDVMLVNARAPIDAHDGLSDLWSGRLELESLEGGHYLSRGFLEV